MFDKDKVIVFGLRLLLTALVSYGLHSFVLVDLNVFDWSILARITYLTLTAVFMVLINLKQSNG